MRFVFISILFLLSLSAFSQSQQKQKLFAPDSTQALTILACPTEMPIDYFGAYAEWTLNNRLKFGVAAGHIYRSKYFGFGNHDDEKPWLAYSGTFIRLNAKYFLREKEYRKPFIEFQTTGKELFYNWLNFFDTPAGLGADEEFGFTKSENARQFSFTFHWGFESYFGERFFLEAFYGLSLISKHRNCTEFASWDHYGHFDNTVRITNETQLFFRPDVGIKVGFVLWKKS